MNILVHLLYDVVFFSQVYGILRIDSFKNVEVPDDNEDNLLSLRVKSKEELVGASHLSSSCNQ